MLKTRNLLQTNAVVIGEIRQIRAFGGAFVTRIGTRPSALPFRCFVFALRSPILER
jgi:hypothetical protein